MGRIPEDELARLKREVALVELVRAAGIELKRHGANWLGRCPFHDDRTPSLVITPAKNLWHCLGACQASGQIAGGSVIDWVMRRERVSFRHAVERLRRARPCGLPSVAEAPGQAGEPRGGTQHGIPGGAAATLPAGCRRSSSIPPWRTRRCCGPWPTSITRRCCRVRRRWPTWRSAGWITGA